MAATRRIIWLTDEEWTAAKKQAASHDLTVSAYLRALVVGGRLIPPAVEAERRAIDARPNPYNTRPFTPVPKR